MTDERVRVLAGECTTEFTGSRARTQRGHVVVVVKPDDTVLVHDADGYQPAAWLTRPESLTVERDPTVLTARDGDQRLRVEVHREHGEGAYPASIAGVPVGRCPDCDGTLVRRSGAVACTGCDARHGLPSDATVLADQTACDCGLPRMAVERGDRFELCIDYACESLDAAVADRLDGTWTCPDDDCDGDLEIRRPGRNGLLAGCERYPDCERAFVVPAGTVSGDCECGLPTFETASGRRCLDARCELAG